MLLAGIGLATNSTQTQFTLYLPTLFPAASVGLKINVTKAPADTLQLPNSVEGVPVKVEVTGKIRKRTIEKKGLKSLERRIRPQEVCSGLML